MTFVAAIKKKLRILPEPVRNVLRLMIHPMREWRYLNDWLAFKSETSALFKEINRRSRQVRGTVLIHSGHCFIPSIKEELIYAAILSWYGYQPLFLTSRGFNHERYIKLLSTSRIVYWDDFYNDPDSEDYQRASRLVDTIDSVHDLVMLEHDGIAVGRHALSWFMRMTRSGTVILDRDRTEIIRYIANSMATVRAALSLLNEVKVSTVLMNERGYTPFGEFFDIALKKSIRTIQYVSPHRDDARVYKAYTLDTRTEHPYSLSDESWRQALAEPFSITQEQELLNYWKECYASRTWFNFQRLQHLTQIIEPEAVISELKLDPYKKTAVVFAHIFWDATFFYGNNIYFDYQSWFIETVKLANQNKSVNWIIKLHPVNVWRLEADGVANKEYAEIKALEEAGVALSPHVHLLMPDTTISTWSLFQVADYCVTVRGTVGIEMASLGKRVITAGTGHYSTRGFTTSPDTVRDYEKTILNIHELPLANDQQRNRALRYAYWMLTKKPFAFGTFAMEYENGKDVFHPLNGRPRIFVTKPNEILESPIAEFWARWVVESQQYDCIYVPYAGQVRSASTAGAK